MCFLDLSINRIKAEEEVFLRGVDNELTPDKMYNLTLAITGDENLAQSKKAWQLLNNTR